MRKVEGKLGIRSSGTAKLILDGVELGDEHVLGKPGEGYKLVLDALGRS